MNAWHLVGGAVAGLLLLAGCGDATSSEEYQSLEVEAASTQHDLDLVKTELDKAASQRDRLSARVDVLHDQLARIHASDTVRGEALKAKAARLRHRVAAVERRTQALDDRAAELAQEQQQLARGTFGASGTFVAGTDMSAGTYFAPGGAGCHWAFKTGTGPRADVVLARDGPTPQYIVIEPGEIFSTRGCGHWVAYE